MIVIAADPGINGALACYSSIEGLLETADIPTCSNGSGPASAIKRKADATGLRELLRGWSRRHRFAGDDVIGVIERPQPFTRPGAKGGSPATMVSLGHTAGLLEGVLSAHCSQVLTPMPRQWKSGFGLSSDKSASVAEVVRRFNRRLRHDQAEAVLLALWGAGQVNGPLRSDGDDDPFAEAA